MAGMISGKAAPGFTSRHGDPARRCFSQRGVHTLLSAGENPK
jgi:hypothetical protein